MFDVEQLLQRKIPKLKIELTDVIMAAVVLVYCSFFSWFTWHRHQAFGTFAYDLGIVNQSMWSTLHGYFFYSTPNLGFNPSGCLFGEHFVPILFFLLPLYAAYPHPQTLLVLQTFGLGFAAFPLYLIGRKLLISRLAPLCVALAFLLNPFVHSTNIYDFHPESFLPLFAFFTFYFYLSKKWKYYLASKLLATLTIDFAALIMVFTSLYELVVPLFPLMRNKKKMGDLLSLIRKMRENAMIASGLILSLVMFWVALAVISFLGPMPLSGGFGVWRELGTMGLGSVILGLFDPQKLARALSLYYEQKMVYWILLISPFIVSALFKAPSLFMTMPWMIASVTSSSPCLSKIGYHHGGAFAIPFLFIACIEGIDRMGPKNSKMIGASVLVSTIMLSCSVGPLNPLISSTWGIAYTHPALSEHTHILSKALKLIPSNASVLAQNEIFPHVSNRLEAYLWLPENTTVDYLIADWNSPLRTITWRWYNQSTVLENIGTFLKTGSYGFLVSADGVILLKRNYDGSPIIFQPLVKRHNYEELVMGNGILVATPESFSGKILIHRSQSDETFWYGPYAPYPVGSYIVTFRLKPLSTFQTMTLDVAANKGRVILTSKDLTRDSLELGIWQNVTLSLSLTDFIPDLEFRGMNVVGGISLDYIEVREIL